MVDEQIYIAELSRILGRAEHTIRQWLARADFPADLQPSREGGRGKLYWSAADVPGLRDYAAVRSANRGSFGRDSVSTTSVPQRPAA